MRSWIGIVALLATGAWLAFGNAWTPVLWSALVAHVVVGVLVVPLVLRGLFRRLRSFVPELAPQTAFATLVLVVLVFLLPYLRIPIGLSPSHTAWVWLALAVSGAVALRGLRGWFGRVIWSPRFVVELLHALLWAMAATTGPMLVLLGGGRPLAMLFAVHRFGGLLMVGLGVIALGRIAWARIRDRRPIVVREWGVVLVATLVIAAAAAEPRLRVREVAIHLSTTPYAERPEAERDALPLPFDPELASLDRSCGVEGGCHAGVLADHARSSHDRSMKPRHFQRTLELLAHETGAEETAICLGCHQPSALAEPQPPRPDYAAHSDMGCVFCHSFSRVELSADRTHSVIHLRLDERGLEPFRGAERNGGVLGRWLRWAVDLTPRAHGRALAPAVLKSDAACLVCHQAQIEPAPAARSCVTCHMPPRQQLRLATENEPESLARSHLFPGTNTLLPLGLGDRSTAALLEAWASSEMLTEDFPFEEYRAIPRALPTLGPERLGEFRYVDVAIDTSAPRERGGSWPLVVRTTNLSIDHAFPAGPMDLLEMWLELEVRDETSRVLFVSGQRDSAGLLAADTHRMGGHALDRDGHRLERYRVWRSAGDVVERSLDRGESTIDRFEVPLPADVGQRLTIRARWLYREINPEFARWAYDGQPPELPVIEVARGFAQAPVPRVRS